MTFEQFLPTTDAVTTPKFFSDQYDWIMVSADRLNGSEMVTLYCVVGSVLKQVTDKDGTPRNLTVSVPALALRGGIPYVFSKSVTSEPCAVYVDTKAK